MNSLNPETAHGFLFRLPIFRLKLVLSGSVINKWIGSEVMRFKEYNRVPARWHGTTVRLGFISLTLTTYNAEYFDSLRVASNHR